MRIYTSAQNTEFTDHSSSILDDLSRKDFVDAYALIHFPKYRPMCGRFALFHDAATLAKYLPVERVAFSPQPRYNIAPTQVRPYYAFPKRADGRSTCCSGAWFHSGPRTFAWEAE